jgi:succinoglycan biosynthesis transport protein ExoP
VLGRMADSVLHAVRWGETRRSSVGAALRRMQEHGVAVDGIVMTGVDVSEHQRLALADSSAYHLSTHGYYARKIGKSPAKQLARVP